MKKIIACISLVFAMSAGVTALAESATFDKSDNSVSGYEAETYTTVLITNDETDDIVYVDQNDSGLASTTKFLIKSNAAEGDYTMTLGGNGTTKSYDLTVSHEEPADPVVTSTKVMGKMYSEDEKTYSLGCKAEKIIASACQYIVITASYVDDNSETKTGTAYISSGFTGTGDGAINVAVRVNNVPAGYDVTVGLSDISE